MWLAAMSLLQHAQRTPTVPLMYTACSEGETSFTIPKACQGSIEPLGKTIWVEKIEQRSDEWKVTLETPTHKNGVVCHTEDQKISSNAGRLIYLVGRYPFGAIVGIRLLDSIFYVRSVELFTEDVHALLNIKTTVGVRKRPSRSAFEWTHKSSASRYGS